MAYDKFSDYMYYLLTSPFKRVKKSANNWYILMKVLGSWFDTCMEDVYKAREESMIATCDDIMLPCHAADRKMSRYVGESNLNYRRRIAWFIEIKRLGGTDAGMQLAVRSLGYEAPVIIRAVDLLGDESRWAEFYVLLENDIDYKEPIGFDILKKTVRKVKYSAAKENFLFRYFIALDGLTEQINIRYQTMVVISNYNYRMLDGTWNLDGKVELDAVIRLFKMSASSTLTVNGNEECLNYITHVVERNFWTLNGDVLLDGSRLMSAYRFEEEL